MMRRFDCVFGLLLLLLFVPLCMAMQEATGSKRQKAGETKLEGRWKLIQWKMNGEKKPLPDDADQSVLMIVTGNMFEMKFGDKEYDGGTFNVNPDVTPKTIDIKHVGEKFQGKIGLGVYEFKNHDELWMAIARAGQPNRPGDFESKKGTDHVVFVFRRQ